MVLGVTSPKITINAVMTRVAAQTPRSPYASTRRLVAIAEEPIVTSWPPSSIALMSRARIPMRRVTSFARSSPAVSSACMRARDAAVSAVSAPAKNAAATMLTTMTAMSRPIGMALSRHGRRADRRRIGRGRIELALQELDHARLRNVSGDEALADPPGENECEPAPLHFLVLAHGRHHLQYADRDAGHVLDPGRQSDGLQVRLDPCCVLARAKPESARQPEGASHPDRHRLAVNQAGGFVIRQPLERMAEGVAEIE